MGMEIADNLNQVGHRIWELDFLRGFCVFLMIFDHFMYDLGFIFGDIWYGVSFVPFDSLSWLCSWAGEVYWDSLGRQIIRSLVVLSFIGLSGLSCSFSHSNYQRGCKLALLALLLTFGTYLFDMVSGGSGDYIIRFGILHLLAFSILLYALLASVKPFWLIIIGSIFIVGGFLLDLWSWQPEHNYLAFLGLRNGDYLSADYFPIFPWTGYFLLGAVLGSGLYRQRRSYFPHLQGRICQKPFLLLGRQALLAYLLHQPLVYIFLLLIGSVFR
ncbi:MAG: heparan-alpha-glucosaminide N-acetyltransferase, partial [Clostridiales bacterium]